MKKTPSGSSSGSGSGSGSGASPGSKKKVTFATEIDEKRVGGGPIRRYMCTDIDGLEKFFLRSPNGASAKVSLLGGQVLSWMTNRGEELLFNSSMSLKPPNALRGGIQVCFPQFGKGDVPKQHGFARTKFWKAEDNPPPLPPQYSTDNVFVDLLLKPTEDDMKDWPHRYELRLRVALGNNGNLTLVPRVRNMDANPKPCVFTFAFFTHFSVSDISEVRVEGLATLNYLDNLKERELCTEQETSLTFESETDRIYKESDAIVTLFDHELRKTIHIKRNGLPDIPVWNPWERKGKAMRVLGKDEYKRMVCVGGAAVDPPITLQSGMEWTGRMELVFWRGS